MKSMALRCVKPGEVELEEIEITDPADNEIQIRIHASVISQGTERAVILNLANTPGEYPRYLGYSVAGVVEKTGKTITRFHIGDRVACNGIGHRSLGNVDERWVMPIPDNVTFEEASFLTLGVISLQGVRKARLELGESVMSLGMGIIGQLALQLSAIHGALPAIGVDKDETRLHMARGCGSYTMIDSSGDRWKKDLLETTQGHGPHVVIESTGFPDAIAVALEVVRKYGRVVLLGSTRGDASINFYKYVHKKSVTLIGAHAPANPVNDSRPGYWTWQDDAACFIRLLEDGRINIGALITHRVSWENAREAYEEILSWNSKVMGVVMKWQ